MNERYENIIQKLQQGIAQQAANSQTQIAVLQTDLEAAQAEIERLSALVPKDVESKDSPGDDVDDYVKP